MLNSVAKFCCRYGRQLFVLLCVVLFSWWLFGVASCEHEYAQGHQQADAINQAIFNRCFARGSISAIARLFIYISRHNAAFFALITTISTAFIALFTFTLYRATSEQGDLTLRAVDLAEKQFLMEGRQADLAEKQHGLARLQHIAANKPRLRIRSVSVERSVVGSAPMFKRGYKLHGNLVVANIGATDAVLKESRYRFYWSGSGLPMEPPLEGETIKQLQGAMGDQIIAGFESCVYPIGSDDELSGDVQITPKGGGIKLYVMGRIRYADITGKERFVGFCREYVPPDDGNGDGHFVPVSNGDYEFED